MTKHVWVKRSNLRKNLYRYRNRNWYWIQILSKVSIFQSSSRKSKSPIVLELKNIVKTYITSGDSFNALDGVSLNPPGEFISITGSGSGNLPLCTSLASLEILPMASLLEGRDISKLGKTVLPESETRPLVLFFNNLISWPKLQLWKMLPYPFFILILPPQTAN